MINTIQSPADQDTDLRDDQPGASLVEAGRQVPPRQFEGESSHGNSAEVRFDEPKVSIVAIAKNESTSIQKCLVSLLDQDYPNFEVIFVDGGSTDDTLGIARSLSRISSKLTVTYDPGSTPGSGRNRGISLAKGEILAFVDGDCYFERNWLRRAVQYLIANKESLAGVGGPNIQIAKVPSRCTTVISVIQSTSIGNGGSVELAAGRNRIVKSISFRNAVFWSKVFNRVGLFDMRLSYCEDSEICQRIRDAGYELLFAEDLGTNHLVKYDSVSSLAMKMYKYGVGRGTVIRTHGRLLTWFAAGALAYAAIFATTGLLGLLFRTPILSVVALALLGLYFMVIVGFSLLVSYRLKTPWAFGWALVGFPAVHVPYTLGLVVGLANPRTNSDKSRLT